jgi:DNA polymerase-3 subunit epsilon
MGALNKEIFVCLDCETTGLDHEKDQIIEVALVRFNFDQTLDAFETLIDPQMPIPEASTAIHHITDQMIQGSPKIGDVLPKIFEFLGQSILVGHGITTDVAFLSNAAKRCNVSFPISTHPFVDTLRLARLYGESPTNSLEVLRRHFNIQEEGAHRAMNDVIVNVEVFKYLSRHFKTTEQMLERLKSPIALKAMPLGKYKGRPFSDISLEYLVWASHQKFDQDLLHSIRTELKKRKRGPNFGQSASPFSSL